MMQQMVSMRLENEEQRVSRCLSLEQGMQLVLLTDRGGRNENQDAWAYAKASDGSLVICVADGLGGHHGGRIAAACAVEGVLAVASEAGFDAFSDNALNSLFTGAQEQILARKAQDSSLADMRSTLVVLLIKDGLACWGHIGDVRLYHLREGAIANQTRDQSVPQMLADMGEISSDQIRGHPDRNRVLQALGKESDRLRVSQPTTLLQLKPADNFFLSTDGFWEWIEEPALLAAAADPDLPQAVLSMERSLLRVTAGSDDFDNYTLVALRILKASRNCEYWHKTRYVPSVASESDAVSDT